MEDRSAGRWCAECNDHGNHHTEKHAEHMAFRADHFKRVYDEAWAENEFRATAPPIGAIFREDDGTVWVVKDYVKSFASDKFEVSWGITYVDRNSGFSTVKRAIGDTPAMTQVWPSPIIPKMEDAVTNWRRDEPYNGPDAEYMSGRQSAYESAADTIEEIMEEFA